MAVVTQASFEQRTTVSVADGRPAKDERCHDPEGFHTWLRTELDTESRLIERIVNPNSVRVGSLPSEARDTFYEKTERPDAKREAMTAPLEVIEDNRRKKAG